METYGLKGDALAVAQLAIAKHPWTKVTSGKRTREEQADAMAANETKRKGWIAATYVDSGPKRAVLDALDMVKPRNRTVMYVAILGVLRLFSDDELRALTAHANGEAFDLQPELRQVAAGEKLAPGAPVEVRPDGTRWTLTERASLLAVTLQEQAIARGGRFLVVEGGLIRLHWQAARGR